MPGIPPSFHQRVIQAAETALAQNEFVCLADVFRYLRFLPESFYNRWINGLEPYLEPLIQAGPAKIAWTKAVFAEWVRDRGLRSWEVPSFARTVGPRRELRFTAGDDAEAESMYRLHYFSSATPESRQRRIVEKGGAPPETVVFSILRDSQCSRCKEDLWHGSLLVMESAQPLCLKCAGMGDLEYLPAGDAALTRRARKYSSRYAVVVRYSRAQKRYERQGILVEAAALKRAEGEIHL